MEIDQGVGDVLVARKEIGQLPTQIECLFEVRLDRGKVVCWPGFRPDLIGLGCMVGELRHKRCWHPYGPLVVAPGDADEAGFIGIKVSSSLNISLEENSIGSIETGVYLLMSENIELISTIVGSTTIGIVADRCPEVEIRDSTIGSSEHGIEIIDCRNDCVNATIIGGQLRESGESAFYISDSENQRKVVLGFSREDKFADQCRVIADVLPPEQVFTVPGGHDWVTWKKLFAKVADYFLELKIQRERQSASRPE